MNVSKFQIKLGFVLMQNHEDPADMPFVILKTCDDACLLFTSMPQHL